MSHIKAVLAAYVLSLASPIAHAETIYLKYGMYIKVWKAEEKDGQIEYWVGSTKYRISETAVAKIEAGNGPKVSTRSAAPNLVMAAPPAIQDLTRRDLAPSAGAAKHDKLELPLPKGPKQDEADWTALRTRTIQGDSVNEMRLAEIERDHDARTTSNAYFLAGVLEMQRGDARKASGH